MQGTQSKMNVHSKQQRQHEMDNLFLEMDLAFSFHVLLPMIGCSIEVQCSNDHVQFEIKSGFSMTSAPSNKTLEEQNFVAVQDGQIQTDETPSRR